MSPCPRCRLLRRSAWLWTSPSRCLSSLLRVQQRSLHPPASEAAPCLPGRGQLVKTKTWVSPDFPFHPSHLIPRPCLSPHLRLGFIVSCPGDYGGLLGALSACILCPSTLHVSRPGDLERGLNLCCPSLPVQMPPPGIRDLVPAPFLPGLPLCPFPHSTCPYNFLSPAGDRPQEPRAPSRGRQRRLCRRPVSFLLREPGHPSK